MAVSSKFILQQTSVLKAFGQIAVSSLKKERGERPTLPGPWLEEVVAPHSRELIRTFVRHVGGDPSLYRRQVPPHLFPQWTLGLGTQAVAALPYPMTSAVNAGASMKVNTPLPQGEPLLVRSRLLAIDDNGYRAKITTEAVTGTASAPDALESQLHVYVKYKRRKREDGASHKRPEPPRVPRDARELASFRLKADAGLDFAKLTGDFNPIHWIPAAARAAGFRNTILHGFGTMSRAYAGIVQNQLAGGALTDMDVKFTRPLVLPAQVSVFVRDDQVFVGDAPGGPAYMVGTYAY